MLIGLVSAWGKRWLRVPGLRTAALMAAAVACFGSTSTSSELLTGKSLPELVAYIDLYTTIAFGVLSMFAVLDLVRFFLSRRPELQLIRTAPTPSWVPAVAHVICSIVTNAVLFLVVPMPALVVIGSRANAGWPYFAVLAAVAIGVPVGAALTGAMWAVPVAWIIRFLARHRRGRLDPHLEYALELAYLVSRPYLLFMATAGLVLLIPSPLPMLRSLSSLPFVMPLAAAAQSDPVGVPLRIMFAGVAALCGIVFLVYVFADRISFEERFPRRRVARRLRDRLFSRFHPLLRVELRQGWGFLLVMAVVAAGLTGFLSLHFQPTLLSIFVVAALALLAGDNLNRPLLRSPFLIKASPLAPLTAVLLPIPAVFVKAMVGALVAIAGMSAALWLRGDRAWGEPLLCLVVHMPTMVAPLAVATVTIQCLQIRLYAWRVWTPLETNAIMIGDGLGMGATIAASLYLLFPRLEQPFADPWRTAATTLLLMLAYAGGLSLLLQWAARRLDELEWL